MVAANNLQTKLTIKVSGDKAYTWMDYDLPTPALYWSRDGSAHLQWNIDGFFGTTKLKTYLSDIKLRVCKTLDATIIDNHSMFPHMEHTAKLNQFKMLDSANNVDWHKYTNLFKTIASSKTDGLFDSMRFATYDYVRKHGKGSLSIEWIEQIGLSCMNDFKKGRSDARGKAKAIYLWVMENYQTNSGRWVDWTLEKRAAYRREYRAIKKLTKPTNSQIITSAIKKLTDDNTKPTSVAISKLTGLSTKTIQRFKSSSSPREEATIKTEHSTPYKCTQNVLLFTKTSTIKEVLNIIGFSATPNQQEANLQTLSDGVTKLRKTTNISKRLLSLSIFKESNPLTRQYLSLLG